MADRLTSIRKQIAALQEREAKLVKARNKEVIETVRALIAKHGLTAEDIGLEAASPVTVGRGRRRSAATATRKGAAAVGVPKYRDPKSGKTWTGRGKPPSWIAKARDRTKYLIDSAESDTGSVAAPANSGTRRGRTGTSKPKAARVGKAKPARKAAGHKAEAPALRANGTKPTAKKAATNKQSRKSSTKRRQVKPAEQAGAENVSET